MPRKAALNVVTSFVVIQNAANMSVTTKRGDDGKSRWPNHIEDKDGPLLAAIGDLDELQAVLQLVSLKSKAESQKLELIIHDLYKIMGAVAYNTDFSECSDRIRQLEYEICEIENNLPKLGEFITFKNELGACFNWARVVARRAERSLVSLSKVQKLDPQLLAFMNRLSDYLFMLGRSIK